MSTPSGAVSSEPAVLGRDFAGPARLVVVPSLGDKTSCPGSGGGVGVGQCCDGEQGVLGAEGSSEAVSARRGGPVPSGLADAHSGMGGGGDRSRQGRAWGREGRSENV